MLFRSAAGPRGIGTPIEYGWVHDELLVDGRWRIAPAPLLDRLAQYTDPEPGKYVLAPRREMAWSNSIPYGPTPVRAVVRVHPGDATAGEVMLTTGHGSITTAAVADATVRAGVVSITHGHIDDNPGELTSGDDGIDTLTAMPLVAGLDVRVTRAEEASA